MKTNTVVSFMKRLTPHCSRTSADFSQLPPSCRKMAQNDQTQARRTWALLKATTLLPAFALLCLAPAPAERQISKGLLFSDLDANHFSLTDIDNITIFGNLNAVSVLADGTERLRFAEPGAKKHAVFKEPLVIDLTNPETNFKRGLSIYSYTTNSHSRINTGGIRLITYTPPDNGGDVSGLFSLQTGGGNAITAYNKSSQVPIDPSTGSLFPTYPTNGFAIEATADDEKTSIESTAYQGFAFWGQTLGSSRASTIFNASPRDNNSHGTRRAFRVQNITHPDDGPPVRPREIFFVQLDGAIYTEGSVGLGVNPGSSPNVQLDAKRDIRTAGVLISGKGLRPPHLRDSAAENDTIYFSDTRGALVYKDVNGSVHKLY